MAHILAPIRGEAIYATHGQSTFIEFLAATGRNTDDAKYPKTWDYQDTTSSVYCYPEFRLWVLNTHLSRGLILVGVDGDSWIFATPENIVGGA